MPKNSFNQNGQILIIIVIFIVILFALYPTFSKSKPGTPTSANPYISQISLSQAEGRVCTDGIFGIPPTSPPATFTAPSFFNENDNEEINFQNTPLTTYKLIRSQVPINAKLTHTKIYSQNTSVNNVPSQILFTNGDAFIPSKIQDPTNQKLEIDKIYFHDHGLAYVLPLNPNGRVDIHEINPGLGYVLSDIYQDSQKPDLDLKVYLCNNQDGTNGKVGVIKGKELEALLQNPISSSLPQSLTISKPPQNIASAPANRQLQLEYFLFGSPAQIPSTTGGVWTPGCKPALYLYPKTPTFFNVKVTPLGYLTLTIPPYPQNGWSGWAHSSGQISVDNKNYDYLYYEAKIKDQSIQKPATGFVSQKTDLNALFMEILPKLGLNRTQTKDFTDYWSKALPPSPYYFIGIMDQTNLNHILPLEITPKPDSINRVHLYFEPLNTPIEVSPPTLTSPKMSGFKAVEWGGLIKTNKTHPFTCSQ